MSKISIILNAYRKNNLKGFLRFLLLKEREKRKFWLDALKSRYNKQLFIEQVTQVGSGLKIGPRNNFVTHREGGKIIIGNDVSIYILVEITICSV